MDDAAHRDVIERTAEYVRSLLAGESSGHDWCHIERVWKTAIALAEREAADRYIVELAALLHDVDDWKLRTDAAEDGPVLARAWMERCEVEPAVEVEVCDIIEHVSFKGAGVSTSMRTREGMVVQDADRLDALGAIGIARAFAYGGHKGRPMHDPEAQPQLHTSFEQYQANQGTTINHFHEKLLLLQDRMNTETARAIARQRTEYMQAFLDEFFREWDARDAPPSA